MKTSAWPSLRSSPSRSTPAMAPTTPPTISTTPMRKSILPRRHCASAPGHRGGDDLVGAGRDGDGWGNPREHQERREQKAAADPEHAGEEAQRRAKAQHHQEIHRDLGDGQIDLEHWAGGLIFASFTRCSRGTPLSMREGRPLQLCHGPWRKSQRSGEPSSARRPSR